MLKDDFRASFSNHQRQLFNQALRSLLKTLPTVKPKCCYPYNPWRQRTQLNKPLFVSVGKEWIAHSRLASAHEKRTGVWSHLFFFCHVEVAWKRELVRYESSPTLSIVIPGMYLFTVFFLSPQQNTAVVMNRNCLCTFLCLWELSCVLMSANAPIFSHLNDGCLVEDIYHY